MRYGMDEKLGHVALEPSRPAFLDLPVQLLSERRDTLDRGARQLLAEETLSGEDMHALLQAPLPAAAAKPKGGFS